MFLAISRRQILLDGKTDKSDIERRALCRFLFEDGEVHEKAAEKDFEKAFKEDFGDHPGDA